MRGAKRVGGARGGDPSWPGPHLPHLWQELPRWELEEHVVEPGYCLWSSKDFCPLSLEVSDQYIFHNLLAVVYLIPPLYPPRRQVVTNNRGQVKDSLLPPLWYPNFVSYVTSTTATLRRCELPYRRNAELTGPLSVRRCWKAGQSRAERGNRGKGGQAVPASQLQLSTVPKVYPMKILTPCQNYFSPFTYFNVPFSEVKGQWSLK
jgi:hypothetical protein